MARNAVVPEATCVGALSAQRRLQPAGMRKERSFPTAWRTGQIRPIEGVWAKAWGCPRQVEQDCSNRVLVLV